VKKIGFCLCFLFVIETVYAQITEEIISDSLVYVDDTRPQHSVKKAFIFSAILPGMGQVYNHLAMPKGQKKAHWKIPLIYAGLGLTSYFALKNNQEQKELRQEYTNRNDLNIYTQKYINYDNTSILLLYQQRLNQRDLLFIGLGLVYLFQAVDAAVEAHFVHFELSQDLSIAITPYMPIGISFKLYLN